MCSHMQITALVAMGHPLPAERARCRTSLIDVIASLEMGMPPLKGLASSLDGAWPASILNPSSLCPPLAVS